MNFKSFYTNTEARIIDTILSIWVTGDPKMQNYIRDILSIEKVLAKPVFQNMFPWEPYTETLKQINGIFSPEFIQKIDSIKNEEYRFPADRHPYKHQVDSWRMSLVEKKSILVTTGTGSGKTECFMLPVLQDIYTHNPNSNGVNAIFLYPLNALIGSQKKRMHAWCQALGKIKYGIYNGSTLESVPSINQAEAYPEIISRANIRNTPPQVLFTNPTMLEYMLVRDKDTNLLNNSRGQLRWILLDEAHTLTGSKAAEMALLIRRVIDAFCVDINNVRFAVTSATVGNNNDSSLKQFMADLCGISTSSIEIIKGKRILPVFDTNILVNNNIQVDIATQLRNLLYHEPCLDSKEIGNITKEQDLYKQLEYIDTLAEISDASQSYLPVRGHFFARNISGLYACTNANCNIHPNIPDTIIGSLTTISKKLCDCGYPLLELISCQTCGNYMMEGEKVNNIIKQSSNQNNDLFYVDNHDEEEDKGLTQNSISSRIVLVRQFIGKQFVTDNVFPVQINESGLMNYDSSGQLFELHDTEACPFCGDSLAHPFHFRLSAAFINRVMSDVILEQTDNANPMTREMLWSGKKYISFTDSRQGTAKISALINIDSESFWLRSQVYHSLSKKIKDNQPQKLTEDERKVILEELEKLRLELKVTNVALLADRKREQISEFEAMLNMEPPSIQKFRIPWREMKEILIKKNNDFYNLFFQNINGSIASQGKDYLSSLLFNEFARRLPRERSLENLGMVNLTYPGLDRLIAPEIATKLRINQDEWKSLTKIALDYIIRYKYHYSITNDVRNLASIKHRSYPVYSSDTTITNVLKWPVFERHRNPTNRLALLICVGLGYSDPDLIDNEQEDQINDLLRSLWNTIRTHFLTMDGPEGGYKIDLEEKASFELADRVWLCPVKKRLIDTTFRGYSPWIKGRLASSNLESFRVGDPISFPIFPYPFNLDEDNIYNTGPTINWITTNPAIDTLKKKGLWNGLHERIINFKPLYLAGEHSAQQQQTRLQQLEEKFQAGKINILSCSTTMEMGVDIGGISAVVMSNVPPSPANYLQRTGRAGRRRENKALAFTICAANPIGNNVIANPKWALIHPISAPTLTFNSKAVVLRHLNAFMFGKFIQETLAGINIKETIDNFFFKNLTGSTLSPSQTFLTWLLTIDPSYLSTGLKNIVENTPLSNNSFFAIINEVYSNFEFLFRSIQQKNETYNVALRNFLSTAGYTEDSPAYKAVFYQKNQFLNTNLLGYLAEEGFLPAGGIPTGVVDFNNVGIADIGNAARTPKQLPSYHITRAISEYAPGMNIVIDGWSYRSAGISLRNNWGGEASKNILQHCTFCGFEHIVQQGAVNIPFECPHCTHNSLRGLDPLTSYAEIIEPAGFSIDLYEEKTREIDSYSNVQYVQPLLIRVEPWSDASHPVFEYRDSKEHAEIIYYNYGAGNGYSVCLECGRADPNPDALIGHRRLRGGRDTNNSSICNGNENPFAIRKNVLLVGRFQTDFFEMRCKDKSGQLINDETILYSIGQAISKCLTTFLGVEEQEIDFGIKRYRGFLSVFLFDTAKGGAGYVSQCGNYIEEICNQALSFLQNCNCKSACTKCLIDRRSQFHLDKLDRLGAIDWLQRMVDNKVPEDVMAQLPNHPQRLVGTIKNEWARLLSKKQLQEVWMLVDWKTIDNWNIEDFALLNQIKLNTIPIHLVFRGLPHDLTLEQKLTLVQCKMWSTLHYTDDFNTGGMELIGRVQLSNGQTFDYFANQYQAQLDANWGTATNNFVYKQDAVNIWTLPSFDVRFDELQTDITEVLIPSPDSLINSFGIFDEFYKLLPINMQKRMAQRLQGRKVNFTYSDRYLFKPFGCQLLFHFVMAMKRKLDLNIGGITFLLQNNRNQGIKSNTYIFEDFEDGLSRKQFLERIGQECGIPNIEVIVDDNLQHFRFLNIEPEGESSITIRPDAGIEHGWFATKKYIHTDELSGKTELTIQQKLNKELLYTMVFNE